jgi:hypothetical protein
VSPAEALAAVTFFGSIAMVVIGAGHYVTKLARLRNERLKPSADVERRLARLEVAIDDMTAEIGRMTETLSQRLLPAEVSHGSE